MIFLSSLSPLPENNSPLAVLRVNAKADFWQGKGRTSKRSVIYGYDKVFLKVAHQENDFQFFNLLKKGMFVFYLTLLKNLFGFLYYSLAM